jgi:hypothetical protein
MSPDEVMVHILLRETSISPAPGWGMTSEDELLSYGERVPRDALEMKLIPIHEYPQGPLREYKLAWLELVDQSPPDKTNCPAALVQLCEAITKLEAYMTDDEELKVTGPLYEVLGSLHKAKGFLEQEE